MRVKIPVPNDYIEFYNISKNQIFSRDEFFKLLDGMERDFEGILEKKISKGISFADFFFSFVNSTDYNDVLGYILGATYIEIMGIKGFKASFREQYKECFSRMREKFEREKWEGKTIGIEGRISGARECGTEEVEAFCPRKDL